MRNAKRSKIVQRPDEKDPDNPEHLEFDIDAQHNLEAGNDVPHNEHHKPSSPDVPPSLAQAKIAQEIEYTPDLKASGWAFAANQTETASGYIRLGVVGGEALVVGCLLGLHFLMRGRRSAHPQEKHAAGRPPMYH